MSRLRTRRIITAAIIASTLAIGAFASHISSNQVAPPSAQKPAANSSTQLANQALAGLSVKGRAPKTGYSRQQFGGEWLQSGGCDTRNRILQRDLQNTSLGSDGCVVVSGNLHDPYTNKTISFTRGAQTSDDVQIDHIVAVSDAWQKGAQQLTQTQREAFYNDPLNLIAIDGPTNMLKGDADAATWLPPNRDYRCRYVARQIAVKAKYQLWITQAEHNAMQRVLGSCPDQVLPIVSDG